MVDLYDLVCAQSFSQGLEVHLLEMVTCTPAMERSCKVLDAKIPGFATKHGKSWGLTMENTGILKS